MEKWGYKSYLGVIIYSYMCDLVIICYYILVINGCESLIIGRFEWVLYIYLLKLVK